MLAIAFLKPASPWRKPEKQDGGAISDQCSACVRSWATGSRRGCRGWMTAGSTRSSRARLTAVAPLVGERLDPELIRGQWHELLRLAASSAPGPSAPRDAQAARVLPRPPAAPLRRAGPHRADLVDPPMGRGSRGSPRHRAGAVQRRGPQRARPAVCLHRFGRFRDRSLESQATRASALNLVIAAVILWNTAYLHRARPSAPAARSSMPRSSRGSRPWAGSTSPSPATTSGRKRQPWTRTVSDSWLTLAFRPNRIT